MSAAIIVILLTTFFCWLDSKDNSNKGLVISAVIISIYGGFRYMYGSDYPSYVSIFNELSSYSVNDDFSYIRTEIGWNLLNVICQPIGFFGMVILITTFETIVIYRFIGKYVDYKYHWFASLCYTLNTEMMLLGFSMMRQFLAMCIFLIAVDFIVNKKWYIAIPIVAFAGLFHTSAFVLVPFCFLGYIGNNTVGKKGVLIFTVVTLLFYFFGGPVISAILPDIMLLDVFDEYGDQYTEDNQVSMFSLARIFGALIFVLIMIYYNQYKREEKVLSLLFGCSVLLGSLVSVVSMAGRITLYFTLVGIAAIPVAVKYIKANHVKIGFIAVYLLFLLYRFRVFFNTDIWSSFRQYHTIFEQSWQ